MVAGLATAVFEQPHIEWTPAFAGALAYTVVFASTICFLLQMRAQREMSSARAALIFCFEPLFAAVTSWLVMGERLSLLQWSGGALILVGMVLAELKPRRPSSDIRHPVTERKVVATDNGQRITDNG